MRVLLTGGTGFVGRHVAAELARRGHGLRCLVRDPGRAGHLSSAGHDLVQGDLAGADGADEWVRGVDAVVHVAGLVRARSREEFRRVNAVGSARLAAACARRAEAGDAPGRFVLVSSQAAGSPSGRERPVDESAPERPVSWYGWSKLLGERLTAEALPSATSLTVVRPPAVFGPHDRDILEFFRLSARGVQVRVGCGTRRVSVIHVEDLARGIAEALERPAAAGQTYYLADPSPWAMDALVREIGAAVGELGGRSLRARLPLPDPLLRVAGAVAEEVARLRGAAPLFDRDHAAQFLAAGWACDPSRAVRDLDWAPAAGVPQRLRETARWYREQGWI